MCSVTSLFLAALMFTITASEKANLLSSFEDASLDVQSSASWRPQIWDGNGRFDIVAEGRDGGRCLFIESNDGGDLSWVQRVKVEPGAAYQLVGWVKSKDVEASNGRGVLINIHGKSEATLAITGTSDWTKLEMVVLTGNADQIQINFTLGGWGKAAGQAWFDLVTLEKLDLSGLEPEATIQLNLTGAEINPFIYGQFIEHLGRCIYGGIWAEMLQDRKFYFPIEDQYNPYRDLRDSKFPVVGASPWEVIGKPKSVKMIKRRAFVGEHSPLISADGGIRHRDLGLVKGKKYEGYVWLKTDDGRGAVNVSLVWGDDDNDRETVRIADVGTRYKKYPFEFTAGASTDKGLLEIQVGSLPCYVGAVSLMPADNVRGMRSDTLALLKKLDAPMYRWPGGNFVSGYDWRDGIGPRDRRVPRKNPAWTGIESNDFGIDEFLEFCREVNAEPLVTVNTGFGDAYSAAQEVEYCNGSSETLGGSWRTDHGKPEPYGVKYWCVGNEMYGPWQLGFMQLHHYTQKHNQVAEAMKKVDSDIELIASGELGNSHQSHDPEEKRSWSRGMLEESADEMDYISEHFYIRRPSDDIPRHVANMVNAIRGKAEGHRKLQAQLDTLKGRIIPIVMDEWNYWYEPYEYGELGCIYRLRDALGVAAGLHEYFRNSDIIQMAHYAQTVNVIGCIKTTKTDAFMDATALPLMLYRREFGSIPVEVSGNYGIASLDVAAALTEKKDALTLGVVNPHPMEKTLKINIEGGKTADKATRWRIAGDDPTAFNTTSEQAVSIRKTDNVTFDGEVKLPPYSVNLYRIPLEAP
jgi:alpha-N-arabinofuranosidase